MKQFLLLVCSIFRKPDTRTEFEKRFDALSEEQKNILVWQMSNPSTPYEEWLE